ncbi:SUF system NifU family Fe-S cluster assembly protein [Candidatus Woesearchaeota archaeon]|nr:SUF system NifU family Fe-S cluster assembly protein [Candidatus Woesearchaeota archaeon]
MKEQISEGSLSEEEEIYRENILDHYRNPRNKEKPESCSFQHLEHNPVCGDRIELFVKLSGSRVEESSFLGEGCAISQASASMLTDKIKGMPVSELQDMAKEDVLDMLGISIGIVRLKCAMLSLKALHKGLEQYTENNRKKQ